LMMVLIDDEADQIVAKVAAAEALGELS